MFHCLNFYVIVLQNSGPEATAKQGILGTLYMSFSNSVKNSAIRSFYGAKFKMKIYFKEKITERYP